MRLLLVKMSSMGDLVHTLPGINDALAANKALEITWLVEEAFMDIPAAHPGVAAVLPICFRRFRKNPVKHRAEFFAQIKKLRSEKFDIILDAQGLFKSAIIASLSGCSERLGYDYSSAREGLCSALYTRRFAVPRNMHAVDRCRLLFARTLDYPLPDTKAKFGLEVASETSVKTRIEKSKPVAQKAYGVFLHGTTWDNKQWPEAFWKRLAKLASAAGYGLKLPAGNTQELQRAQRIGADVEPCQILDKTSIRELMGVCSSAAFVVSVDTGLGHLAAALDVPVLGLFGPTETRLTGIRGVQAGNLKAEFSCAPCMQRKCSYQGVEKLAGEEIEPACFSSLTPDSVWQAVLSQLRAGEPAC